MLTLLASGVVFGLAAGFSPGPLLALVIAETLRHDVKAGLMVAIAPIVTDLPIVAAALLVLTNLSQLGPAIGGITLFGAAFVFYLGVDAIKARPLAHEDSRQPQPFKRGVITNILSPHPYIFWIGVGAPIVLRAWPTGWLAPAAFLLGFYVSLIGAKVLVAVLVGRSKAFLMGRAYRAIMVTLGALLCGFSILLLRDGLKLLNVWQ